MYLQKNLNGEICKYNYSKNSFEQISINKIEIAETLCNEDVLTAIINSKETPSLKSIAVLLSHSMFTQECNLTDSNYLFYKDLNLKYNGYKPLHAFITRHDKLLLCTTYVSSKNALINGDFIVVNRKVFVVLKRIPVNR